MNEPVPEGAWRCVCGGDAYHECNERALRAEVEAATELNVRGRAALDAAEAEVERLRAEFEQCHAYGERDASRVEELEAALRACLSHLTADVRGPQGDADHAAIARAALEVKP